MYKQPEPLEPDQASRGWLWSQKSDYARLQREFRSFRIELALLEARSQQTERTWVSAAHDELSNVQGYVKQRNVEGGWVCLNAARRHAIYALDDDELAIRASVLRAEATKFSSWRATEMLKLLSVEQGKPSADHIVMVMALRDEYFSNQYHKIWMVGQQLAILVAGCALGLLLLTPFVVFYSLHPGGTLAPWGFQMVAAVLFFGLLGAAFSAAGSLMNTDKSTKNVPEQVANQFVTSARAIFGAGAGLAGYAFYQARALDIHVGDGLPGSALAIAFAFGFAGERFIANVLGTLGARQS